MFVFDWARFQHLPVLLDALFTMHHRWKRWKGAFAFETIRNHNYNDYHHDLATVLRLLQNFTYQLFDFKSFWVKKTTLPSITNNNSFLRRPPPCRLGVSGVALLCGLRGVPRLRVEPRVTGDI